MGVEIDAARGPSKAREGSRPAGFDPCKEWANAARPGMDRRPEM